MITCEEANEVGESRKARPCRPVKVLLTMEVVGVRWVRHFEQVRIVEEELEVGGERRKRGARKR